MDYQNEIVSPIKLRDGVTDRKFVKGYIDMLYAPPELVSLDEKVMVIALKNFVDYNSTNSTTLGECYPSREKLSYMLGVGKNKVTTLTKELTQKGIIQTLQRGLNKPNQYLLTDRAEMWSAKSLEELSSLARETEAERAIRVLEKQGYVIKNGYIYISPETLKPTSSIDAIPITAEDLLVARDKTRLFVKVYKDFLESGVLDITEIGVFIILKSFLDIHADMSNTQASVFPSLETLSQKTGKSVRTLQTIIHSLENKGVIEKKRRGLNTSNLYIISDREAMWKSSDYETIKKEASKTEVDFAMDYLQKEQGYDVKDISGEGKQKESDTTEASKQEIKYPMSYIKDSLEYELLAQADWFDEHNKQLFDTCIKLIYEVLNSKQTLRINNETKPHSVVQSVYSKLTQEQVLYAIETYQNTDTQIKRPSTYMKVLLYNAGIGDLVLASENSDNLSLKEHGYDRYSIQEDRYQSYQRNIRKYNSQNAR